MPKRKESHRETGDAQHQAKRPRLPPLRSLQLRRSARLKGESKSKDKDSKYLPSPTNSLKCSQICQTKRKLEVQDDHTPSEDVKRRKFQHTKRKLEVQDDLTPSEDVKRRKFQHTKTAVDTIKHKDFVTYWVHEDNQQPPAGYFENDHNMASSQPSTKRRRNESTSTGRMTERQENMYKHGICMYNKMLPNEASRKFCNQLLKVIINLRATPSIAQSTGVRSRSKLQRKQKR